MSQCSSSFMRVFGLWDLFYHECVFYWRQGLFGAYVYPTSRYLITQPQYLVVIGHDDLLYCIHAFACNNSLPQNRYLFISCDETVHLKRSGGDTDEILTQITELEKHSG